MPELERAAAKRLLHATGMDATKPLVAFDVISRTVREKKAGHPVGPEYRLLGDRRLFDGIDSAVKAAFHWREQNLYGDSAYACLNVPVCVLAKPFWDICIDGGIMAEPEVRECGYQVLSYPAGGGSDGKTVHPVVILWGVHDLPRLVVALDDVFESFRVEIQKAFAE
jgi:hypothetical protein